MALDEEQTKEARGRMDTREVLRVRGSGLGHVGGEWGTHSSAGTVLQRQGLGAGEQGKLGPS